MLWGTTGTTQALAPAGATSSTIGAVRIGLGALALLVIALAAGGTGSIRGFFRSGIRLATVAAMAAMAAYQVAFFAGVARAGVAVGTVVGIGSAPVFTGLLAAVVRGERPGRIWYASTALAVTGAALLVGAGADTTAEATGVVLAVGAGAAYAVYTVSSKELLAAGHRPEATMAVTFSGGALLLGPILLAGDLRWLADPRGVATAAWLGIGTVGVAYVLFARGLQWLPAATVATLTLAEPLTAATLGVVVLGERPGFVAGIGALLVAAGLVLLAVRPLLAAGPTSPKGRAAESGRGGGRG
jgi:drug/metabolite transporter, DME family